jgi:dTDP-4-dehydrorhamnose 3,5-epimerase
LIEKVRESTKSATADVAITAAVRLVGISERRKDRGCMNEASAISMNLPRIIVPERHVDARGWFSETFHEKRLHDIGITCRFVQDNLSSSKRAGTLRGLHFQRPPAAQAKLVTVMQGRITDVAVDIRHGSPTFGRHVSTELSTQSRRQMYIPVGFAHGFLTLEDDTVVMYKVSDYYAPAHDSGIRWNDPDIAIPWPFEDADIIASDKDRRLPMLKELASPFRYDGHPLAPLTVPDPV